MLANKRLQTNKAFVTFASMKWSVTICICFLLLSNGEANAGKVALVIGNSAYLDGPLRNPTNDARLMEQTLTPLGFKVTRLENADFLTMQRAVREFGNHAQNADVAIVYYAGHGMQQDGENWLIPIGAQIHKSADVSGEAIPASTVLNQIEYANATVSIVILDACRNNPFNFRTRSTHKGLGRMDAPSGSIIAYAAQPGAVADDGSGNNGLYTHHLALNLARTDLEIKRVFEETAIAVERESERRQKPREDVGLRGDFYLGESKTPPSSLPQWLADPEKEAWELAKKFDSIVSYEAYMEEYPKGLYRSAAGIALTELRNRKDEELNKSQSLLKGKPPANPS